MFQETPGSLRLSDSSTSGKLELISSLRETTNDAEMQRSLHTAQLWLWAPKHPLPVFFLEKLWQMLNDCHQCILFLLLCTQDKFVDDRVFDIKTQWQKQTESETQLETVYFSLKMKMVAV